MWLRVFDFATFVPGALDTEYDDPFQPSAALNNVAMNFRLVSANTPSIRMTNAFGLQLMLVCKRWHDLFKAPLYRRLQIRNHRHLESLKNQLAMPPPGQASYSSPLSLGALVRRLDLVMKDLPWPGEGYEQVLSSMEDLFELLPNLQILEIFFGRKRRPNRSEGNFTLQWIRFPLKMWEKIGFSCGSSLRRFECHFAVLQIFRLDDMNARDFFRIFPRIRTIGVDVDIWRTRSCWLCDVIYHAPASCLQSCPLLSGPRDDEGCQCTSNLSLKPSDPPCPSLTSAFTSAYSFNILEGPGQNMMKRFFHLQGPLLTTIYLAGSIVESRRERVLPPFLREDRELIAKRWRRGRERGYSRGMRLRVGLVSLRRYVYHYSGI